MIFSELMKFKSSLRRIRVNVQNVTSCQNITRIEIHFYKARVSLSVMQY